MEIKNPLDSTPNKASFCSMRTCCTCCKALLLRAAADLRTAAEITHASSLSSAKYAMRALLQLGRTHHCNSLRSYPGSHRTIHFDSFLRTLHSSRAQGQQAPALVPGSLVPGSLAPVWAAVPGSS